eukprot:3182678-Karenia_brevis.AAC.1
MVMLTMMMMMMFLKSHPRGPMLGSGAEWTRQLRGMYAPNTRRGPTSQHGKASTPWDHFWRLSAVAS